MTFRTLTLALAATVALSGTGFAQDAMSTPMASDAMAPNSMAGDAMATMPADQMLAECLEKAGVAADAMKKDDATKACHDQHNAMGGDAMAPATDAMGGTMAPTN